ncbi:capsular polysaccharide synthesis protein [Streptococcus ruminicola]|uniref:capsular polysaccharide synthesis protein n=1 Tax=Streptococcus ruminicola TaxID=2686210 RepID=UPI003981B2CE
MNLKEKYLFIKNKSKVDYGIGKKFGIKYGLTDYFATVVFREKSKIGRHFFYLHHELVKAYLLEKYGYLLDGYIQTGEKISSKGTIWLFWWQGINKDTPVIVKKCIDSIIANAGCRKVIVIDQDNYSKYISLPDYIIRKLDKKQITLTHFSDILRMALLSEYGGIWMDATLFMVEKIPDDIENYCIYSIKHNLFSDYHVCKGKWSGFFLACGENNSIIRLFRDFFYEYWKHENMLITYFLIDCIIAICYENIDEIRAAVDAIPKNNENVFKLQNNLFNDYSEEEYLKMKTNTHVFKLSWKLDFSSDNKNTFYNKFLEDKL